MSKLTLSITDNLVVWHKKTVQQAAKLACDCVNNLNVHPETANDKFWAGPMIEAVTIVNGEVIIRNC